MKDFGILYGIQLCSYLLITLNYRAVAHGSYAGTAVSDLTFAAVNFTLIKRVAKSESNWGWAGYTLGGVSGSMLGIFVSNHVRGF